MQVISASEAFAILQDIKDGPNPHANYAFYAEFTKKNGDLRKMTCRFGVKSYLKGGEWANGNAGKPEDHWLAIVFDMGKVGYRSIPVKRLHLLRVEGQEYRVEG